MRSILTSAFVLTGLSAGAALAAQPSADVAGTWLTGDGRAKIHIDKCGLATTRMCGTVVWLKSPTDEKGRPRTDIKNADPAKRARPMLGMTLMDGLALDEGKYKGEIYNSDEGKTYSVSLARETASELSISGCLLAILCGSQTWTRVPDEAAALPPGAPAKGTAKAAPGPKTTGSTAAARQD